MNCIVSASVRVHTIIWIFLCLISGVPPANKEMPVWSLGQEDPLEEDVATHSSVLAGESQGQRNLVGHGPQSHKELETTEAT